MLNRPKCHQCETTSVNGMKHRKNWADRHSSTTDLVCHNLKGTSYVCDILWLKFLNDCVLLCQKQLCSQHVFNLETSSVHTISMHVSLNDYELLLAPTVSSIFCVFGGTFPSKTKQIHSIIINEDSNVYIQLQNTCIVYETLLPLQLLECRENDGQHTTGWGWIYVN